MHDIYSFSCAIKYFKKFVKLFVINKFKWCGLLFSLQAIVLGAAISVFTWLLEKSILPLMHFPLMWLKSNDGGYFILGIYNWQERSIYFHLSFEYVGTTEQNWISMLEVDRTIVDRCKFIARLGYLCDVQVKWAV